MITGGVASLNAPATGCDAFGIMVANPDGRPSGTKEYLPESDDGFPVKQKRMTIQRIVILLLVEVMKRSGG